MNFSKDTQLNYTALKSVAFLYVSWPELLVRVRVRTAFIGYSKRLPDGLRLYAGYAEQTPVIRPSII